LTLKMLNN